jgi:hypothetical protein
MIIGAYEVKDFALRLLPTMVLRAELGQHTSGAELGNAA